MKYLIVVVICAFLSTSVNAKFEEECLETLNECGEKSHISEGDLEKIIAHEIPETRNGMCTVACFLKKYDMLTEENTINLPGVKAFLVKVSKGKEIDEEHVKLNEKCAEEVKPNEDECDAVKEILDCVLPHKHEPKED